MDNGTQDTGRNFPTSMTMSSALPLSTLKFDRFFLTTWIPAVVIMTDGIFLMTWIPAVAIMTDGSFQDKEGLSAVINYTLPQ